MAEKRTLKKGAITESVDGGKLRFVLLRDSENFSNGLISMNATHATFKHPVTGEEGFVGVDMGGTQVEVYVNKRSWSLDIKQIVSAAMDADEAYAKGIVDGR